MMLFDMLQLSSPSFDFIIWKIANSPVVFHKSHTVLEYHEVNKIINLYFLQTIYFLTDGV